MPYRPDFRMLGRGMSLKDIALTDRSFPYASRLAMLMVEAGRSDEFFMSWKTVYQRTNAVDREDMEKGMRTVVRHWKFFKPVDKTPRGTGDQAHRYERVYMPKETPEQFKARVLRVIDAELAVLWKVAEITRGGDGGPAPHSNAELAEEVGRDERTVRRCLANLEEYGYFVREAGGHNGRSRSLYFRPDCPSCVTDAVAERRTMYRGRRAERLRLRLKIVGSLAQPRPGGTFMAPGGTFIDSEGGHLSHQGGHLSHKVPRNTLKLYADSPPS